MPTPSGVSPRSQARWDAAADEHEVALAAYLDTAARLSADAWERPWAEGKWTPAQVTEHLTRSYEALLVELREGRAMELKMATWRRTLTRWILLPHILFHRSFPVRAPAPRELRPREVRAGRDEALRALREQGETFVRELAAARLQGCAGLTHPYFGKVEPIKVLRFVGIHMEHHRKQIERAG
ncbi:MAG TPA: DinB family protein [Longimicrobium sp.]|jgi:hypothetical protein